MNQNQSTRLLADIQSPWNHFARRFIEAPVYRLGGPVPPDPLANYWRLELRQDGQIFTVENDKPVLDTVEIWPKLKVGSWIQATLLEGDRPANWWTSNRPLGARIGGFQNHGLIAKAPDWVDHAPEPMDYAASVRRNLQWFDSLEKNPRAYYRQPGLPAYWWHAGEDGHPGRLNFEPGAFPALASVCIRSYLTTAKIWPERAADCRQMARMIGNWFLNNRTPMEGKVPGMPYSAMSGGKFEYSVDGSAVNLSRGALPAYMLTVLALDTGEKKYLEYAQYIAGVLCQFIREDGSMPYRVKPLTGEVVEEYTCGHTLVALFLDALNQVAPDPRWREGSEKIVQWVLQNPFQTFDWKTCFEDAYKFEAFSSMASADAMWATRLLCRHGHVDKARKLFRWVEDQFVNFGDEASLTIATYYPSVREQYLCDFPMEAHGSNYASTCWELHKATGDETYRHKGIATLNAIVQSQRFDGAYSTWGVDRITGIGSKGSAGNWFNCNHMATTELGEFALVERGEKPALIF